MINQKLMCQVYYKMRLQFLERRGESKNKGLSLRKMGQINQRWIAQDLTHYFAIWKVEYKVDLQ